MTRGIVVILAGLLMLCEMLFSVSMALAQAPGGAFQQLSAGNQKAARALHEAQRADLKPVSRLTLDDIAARKQGGQGWTRIFESMKSRGLIDAENFGHVVQAYNERNPATDETNTEIAAAVRAGAK